MKQIGSNSIPIPSQEKLTRWAYWTLGGALAVMGVNKFGPFVLNALNTLFDITSSGLALAALVAGGALAITVGWALIPAIKTGINTLAYRTLAAIINQYPIVQMRIFYESVLQNIEDDRVAKRKLVEIAEANQQTVDALQERIDELTAAVQDRRLSAQTREVSEGELASKLEEKKPYEALLAMLRPVIATAEESIQLQDRAAKALARDIKVQTAKFRASEQMEQVASIFGKNFSQASRERLNYEAARDVVFERFGAASGQIKDMRAQMDVMIQAAMAEDEIKAAAARRHVQDSMRTIEVPMVEVADNPVAVSLPRAKSYLNIK